ncbi:MAG: type II toxin-antitoxin system prevent-host-death family antitoxin [Bryobacterales bacterium]|nr:type II toxin-antitoxin system prevent-host-death family antitoxin [Bryobacterales bacterium]
MEADFRELKDNLSRYIRRVESGEPALITSHGWVVADLIPAIADGQGRTSQAGPWA